MVLRKGPVRKEVLFAIGSFSMLISIVLGRFSGVNPVIDFLAGIFTGMSLSLNLGFLVRWRIERNARLNPNTSI